MPWTAVTTEPSQLGESPFWHPQEHRLYWVDIAGRRVSRLEPSSGQLDHWPMPTEPGCIAPVRGGGLVVALRAGIFLARQWHGALEKLAELPFDAATERANDGKCDALGRFWVGSVHEPKGGPRQPVAALYCVDARGAGPAGVRRMLGGAATANGLAWSPDGSTLYWCDTPSHQIRTWPCDDALEPQGAHSVFQAFAPKPAEWQPGQPGQAVYGGRPDGGTVDVEGAYWSALYEGGRVVRFAPSGEVLADIPTPVRCPTMPCLGGDDGRTLFITSARQGRPAQELADLPQSGCVFSMRVAVPGMPVAYFEHGGS